jgi:hypothetical protein
MVHHIQIKIYNSLGTNKNPKSRKHKTKLNKISCKKFFAKHKIVTTKFMRF